MRQLRCALVWLVHLRLPQAAADEQHALAQVSSYCRNCSCFNLHRCYLTQSPLGLKAAMVCTQFAICTVPCLEKRQLSKLFANDALTQCYRSSKVGGEHSPVLQRPSIPRPCKGSKEWTPLITPWFPQCSNGFLLGGVPFLGSFRGSG